MSPVLLLDMSVVVLLVRTSSRELDLFPFAPSLQMPVDEFRSVVRVQAQKPEGQHPFDLIQGLLHSGLPLPQQRSRLRPGRLNIGDVQRIAELSFTRIPGMRDQIDFREAAASFGSSWRPVDGPSAAD